MQNQYTTSPRKLQPSKIAARELSADHNVRVTVQGMRHCGVVWMERPARGAPIVKLSKDEFLDLRTGEVRAFARNDVKQRNNLSETFRNLMALIRTNFDAEDGAHRQLFITLTYAENMQDHHRLMIDFELWWKKLKRHCKGHTLDYIAVAEPQERGAWHMHVMLKSDKHLFIDNRDMERLWGHGYTDTQRLKSDDVGRYYVGYFTSLYDEIDTDGEVQEATEERTKKQKKGARLALYPVGMKFYRCSRGIVRPQTLPDQLGNVRAEWGQPYRTEAWEIKDPETGDVLQVIQREEYKKK